jgi:excisionase family DNA binding protein
VNAPAKIRHASDSTEWMSVGEAAAQCGMSEETVRRHLLKGTIPVRALRVGTSIRIDRPAWDDWFTASLLNTN